MSDKAKIPGTIEAWESGELGEDEKSARRTNAKTSEKIDEALGLQMISIRLDKKLIDSFKLLSSFHGLGYQPLMRDALKRFADAELKSIVSGLVESQRKEQLQKTPPSKPNMPKMKKAA